jgi:hypothetical protein
LACGEHRKARIRLLALDSWNAELAGGFPSDPIPSGPRRTTSLHLRSLVNVIPPLGAKNWILPKEINANQFF